MIDLTGNKILVVDDEDYIRQHLAKHLRRLGCEVIEANNGREALEKVKQLPDIILMDVQMPEMTGYEVTRTLKSNPETLKTPIVLLSAKAQNSEIEKGIACGADRYLTKPASFPSIVDTVQQLLHSSEVASQ